MKLTLNILLFISITLLCQADVPLPAYLKRAKDQTFELESRLLPGKKEVWLTKVHIKNKLLKNKAKSLKLVVKDLTTEKICFSQKYKINAADLKICGLAFKTGHIYQVFGSLLDAGGEVISSTTGKTTISFEDLTSGRWSCGGIIRNPHLKNWVKPYKLAYDKLAMKSYPFEQKKLGYENIILPGFAPLRYKDGKLYCWGRVYTFGKLGLPVKISAMQPEPTVGEKFEELLVAPIALHMKTKGKLFKINSLSKLKLIDQQKTKIILEGHGKAAGIGFKLRDEVGQDGLIKIKLDIIPNDTAEIERLYLDIPLNRKQVSLMHDVTDVVYRRLDRSKRGLAAGIGGHAGSLQKSTNKEIWSSLSTEKRKIKDSFQPFIWLGNEDRGLCWFADSDRNWSLPANKAALQLLKTQNQLILRINFIHKMVKFKRSRTITFGLLATPVKKALKNWRGSIFPRWATLDRKFYRTLKNVRKFIMVGAGDPNFNAGEASPLALNWSKTKKKYAELKDKKGSTYFEYWCSDYMTADVPEFEKYFSEWINTLQIGWFRKLYPRFNEQSCTWLPINRTVKSLQDYKVWCVDKKLKEVGDFAYYEDNSHPRVFDDPVWGLGFNISKNKRQPEFDLFSYHDYLKRIATVYQNNSCDNLLGVHSSAAMLIPAFTYANFYIDGEQPARYVRSPNKDYIDVWPELDYIRAHVMGRQFGINSIFMSEMTFGGKDPSGKHSRALLALMIPHDIAIWDGAVKNRNPIKKWHKIKNDFGFHGNNSRLFPYWSKGKNKVAYTDNTKILLSVWKINKRLLVMVSNMGEEQDVSFRLDIDKLGLKQINSSKIFDAEDGLPVKYSDGIFKLKVRRHDFRIININSKKQKLTKNKNYVANGSFEDVKQSKAMRWLPKYEGYKISEAQHSAGGKSILFGSKSKGTSYAFAALQWVSKYPKGRKIQLSVDYYISNFENGRFVPFFIKIAKDGKTRKIGPKGIFANDFKGDLKKWITCSYEIDMTEYPDAKGFVWWILSSGGNGKPFEGKIFIDNAKIKVIK